MNPVEAFLAITAVLGGFGIAALAVVMGIRHDRRKRELEHIERMKALELGRTLPRDEPWLSPTKVGALIGVVVPIVAISCAGSATASAGFREEIWIAAGVLGTASAIAGATLVGYAQSLRRQSPDPLPFMKPHVEDDAYDVVSSRG